jgi:hypothetical protein
MVTGPATSPPKRGRLWWVAWLVAGALMGAQAIRMGVAESAVRNGNGARAALIRPQNGWGVAQLAEQKFARGDARGALATSRAALRQTPLTVVAVRTQAQALDKLGGPGGGERAWQAASMMGWRDKPTQLWAVLRALSNGDAEVFAIRADALLRVRDRDRQITPVIRQSLVEPQIRRAFIRRLQSNPLWRERFFVGRQLMAGRELEGSLLALRDLGRTSRKPTRYELRDTIRGLVAAGRYDDAVGLDRQFVRRASDPGSLIDDGGFELRDVDYRVTATPFDWNIVAGGAALDRSQGRRSMALTFDGNRSFRPVDRYVPLAPGKYRLDYIVKGESEAGTFLGVRVYCARSKAEIGRAPALPLEGISWQKRQLDFAVPADCGLVRVTIGPFDGARPSEALFDDVTIRPAA